MNSDDYETSDLGLAAALLASGVGLVGVNKQNPKRAVFVFTDSPHVQEAVADYWDDKLFMSALTYFDATKRLKTRLYS
jgi:hypothetical protein